MYNRSIKSREVNYMRQIHENALNRFRSCYCGEEFFEIGFEIAKKKCWAAKLY